MSFIRRLFSRIAIIATIITAAIPISAISSSASKDDPIAAATRFHTKVFFVYVIILALAALFQWWVWSTNNRLQDAIRKDSDARIEEAKATGAQANARAQRLEHENLLLQGSVAGLQKDAAEAKTALSEQQGKTAILERAASDAKAAQQRVEKELAVQQERAAIAEKSLLEVQERIKPRHLTADQRALLIALLTANPRGAISIACMSGNKESADFARELAGVLSLAGWHVSGPTEMVVFSETGSGPPIGLSLTIASGEDGKVPIRAKVLQQALERIGLSAPANVNPHMTPDDLSMFVGVKP